MKLKYELINQDGEPCCSLCSSTEKLSILNPPPADISPGASIEEPVIVCATCKQQIEELDRLLTLYTTKSL